MTTIQENRTLIGMVGTTARAGATPAASAQVADFLCDFNLLALGSCPDRTTGVLPRSYWGDASIVSDTASAGISNMVLQTVGGQGKAVPPG